MTFGNVLRMLRQRNNLTQKQLASVLDVSESRIGMYERGHREPDFEMLETIADYFNVDMDFLTGRSEIERQYTFEPGNSTPAEWELTYNEQTLIQDYRSLNPQGQAAALAAVHGLTNNPIFKKGNSSASGAMDA